MVAWDLLEKSQNPLPKGKLTQAQKTQHDQKNQELLGVCFRLANSDMWPHSHIIRIGEAEKVGLNISKSPEKFKLLKSYKRWVLEKLDEAQSSHVIQYFRPSEVKKTVDAKPITSPSEEKKAQTQEATK